MIRKVLSLLVMAALCLTLSGCGGNGGGADDAPEGGARRPAPEEPREAPGPKGGAKPAEEGQAPSGGGD